MSLRFVCVLAVIGGCGYRSSSRSDAGVDPTDAIDARAGDAREIDAPPNTLQIGSPIGKGTNLEGPDNSDAEEFSFKQRGDGYALAYRSFSANKPEMLLVRISAAGLPEDKHIALGETGEYGFPHVACLIDGTCAVTFIRSDGVVVLARVSPTDVVEVFPLGASGGNASEIAASDTMFFASLRTGFTSADHASVTRLGATGGLVGSPIVIERPVTSNCRSTPACWIGVDAAGSMAVRIDDTGATQSSPLPTGFTLNGVACNQDGCLGYGYSASIGTAMLRLGTDGSVGTPEFVGFPVAINSGAVFSLAADSTGFLAVSVRLNGNGQDVYRVASTGPIGPPTRVAITLLNGLVAACATTRCMVAGTAGTHVVSAFYDGTTATANTASPGGALALKIVNQTRPAVLASTITWSDAVVRSQMFGAGDSTFAGSLFHLADYVEQSSSGYIGVDLAASTLLHQTTTIGDAPRSVPALTGAWDFRCGAANCALLYAHPDGVYVQLTNDAGVPIGAPIQLAAEATDFVQILVQSTGYLMFWHAGATVAARTVAANGALGATGSFDHATGAIAERIAAVGDKLLVPAWDDHTYRLVDADLATATPLAIPAQRLVGAAALGAYTLIVMQDQATITAFRVNATGTAIDPPTTITTMASEPAGPRSVGVTGTNVVTIAYCASLTTTWGTRSRVQTVAVSAP